MTLLTKSALAGLAVLTLGGGLFDANAERLAERFAPETISLDGKVTLSPAFTPDGETAYFTRTDCALIWQCPQLLYKSDFINGQWQGAERVPGLGNFRVDWPSVSPDGSTLIFSWTAPREIYEGLDIIENFDLFSLDLTDADAKPVAIEGGDINRPRAGRLKTLRAFHVQSAGTLTRRGDLYFWDEREDALGERDIFVAESDGMGGFKTAIPLPGPINSKGRDQLGWINSSGKVMLVAYPDRGGEGGDDIFISRMEDGVWSEPQNLGPHVNSSAYDGAARFTPDGSAIVFTSTRAFEGQREGLLQVWQVPTAPLVEAGILRPTDVSG
ncbi:MAG: hypothetical protein AAGH90_07925 [Pseudomonadota bacterium]